MDDARLFIDEVGQTQTDDHHHQHRRPRSLKAIQIAARMMLNPLLLGGVIAVVGGLAMGGIAVTNTGGAHRAVQVHRPGWVGAVLEVGIRHTRGHVGVGCTSAVRAVHLDALALNHHGYIGGAPGSGKTSLLRLLIQGYPGR